METAWERRWKLMRDAGITREQAWVVFNILADARKFGTETTERSAREKFDEVYLEGEEA